MKARALLAFLLSAWWPGLGQLYAGRSPRAVAFFLGFLGVTVVFFHGIFGRSPTGAVAFVVLVILIRLSSAVDAALLSWRSCESRRWYQRWYVCVPLGVVLALALLRPLAAIQNLKSYRIPTTTMEPTLVAGDRLIAALDAYEAAPPEGGDIVLFESPEDAAVELLKRVVAVGGDTIELRDKTVYVNGTAVDEPWAVHLDPAIGSRDHPTDPLFRRDQLGPLTVPDRHLFLMGDNRDFSYDSRYMGTVPTESVRGAPLYIYWSVDRTRIGIRFGS